MNPYEKAAKLIIDLCNKAITDQELDLDDPIILAYYN